MTPEIQEQRENTRATDGTGLPAAIAFVAGIVDRYEIKALEPLLRGCRSASLTQDLMIAVAGRFKAGKSSFLNQIIGHDLLPVGVVPVTSVITEIAWGPEEELELRFLDGRVERASARSIADFVSESSNPQNKQGVSLVRLRLPELAGYRTLRFVDTPGLESALGHNTETSLSWFPNLDIALVLIGVDPPLSQQDITLIQNLFAYTPAVCVVLTKVDLLDEDEQKQVLQFVRSQLSANFEEPIPLYPYSIRKGFEHLRSAFERDFLSPVLDRAREQKGQVLAHKVKTLLAECSDYLRLRLRSAEMLDSERLQLREQVTDKDRLRDTRTELELLARHCVSGARTHIEKILKPSEAVITSELLVALDQEYDRWQFRFAPLIEAFESWIRESLTVRLSGLSVEKRQEFLKPVHELQRQEMRVLQSFRDYLAQRTLKLFGVPLRTAEVPIEFEAPKTPDVKIGRVFDHNWELLSAVLPMSPLRRPIQRRFTNKVRDEVFKNLSRLTTQWLDIVAASARQMSSEAEHRLSELVATVERMTATPATHINQIRGDWEQIEMRIAQLTPPPASNSKEQENNQ